MPAMKTRVALMKTQRMPLVLLGSLLMLSAVLPGGLGQDPLTSPGDSDPALNAPAPTNFYKGIFINCGGEEVADATGTWNATWVADSYATAGTPFRTSNSRAVVNNGTNVDVDVFRSMRSFGGKDPATNSYSIPVNASGYYIVRLYFAEILYTNASVRIFDVSIEGVPMLQAYSVPGLLQGQVEEFFVPVNDNSVDITFIRGPIGDPMINAISVIPAPAGMYSLDVSSGQTLRTEYRLACGSTATTLDSIGREWTGDMFTDLFWPPDVYTGMKVRPNGDPNMTYGAYFDVTPFHTFNWTKSWLGDISTDPFLAMRNNVEVAPEVLPLDVFMTSRWTDVGRIDPVINGPSRQFGPFISLNYTFTVEPNTEHLVRLGWAYQWRTAANSMIVNVSVDNVEYYTNLDLWLAKEYNGPVLQNVFATSNSSGKMQVAIYPSSNETWYRDVMLTSIEVFRVGQYDAARQNTLLNLNTPPPPPSPMAASTDSQRSDNRVLDIGIGVVAGFFFCAVCLALLLVGLRARFRRRSEVDGDFESLTGGKGVKSDSSTSGSWAHLLGDNANKLYGGFKSGEKSQSQIEVGSGGQPGLWGAHNFPSSELKEGTNNFAKENILGQGGFGIVYKATLLTGHVVAVKRMNIGSQQGEKEFLTEVELLSRLHHRNLVNLVGYSDEDDQLMLVYEYVPNGTLRDYLRDEDKACHLSWPARLKIALGAAKGLEYLHRGAYPQVIHRDIKTCNILLENNFDAKVADFGLSKLGLAAMGTASIADQTHISTLVKGTVGYLDPNYYNKHQLTEKSDIYSFGVVLLEIITGRLPFWHQPGEHENDDRLMNLVEWTEPFLKKGDVAPIVAIQLDVGQSLPSMTCVAELAHRCINSQGKARPNITEVVRDLEEAKRLLEVTPAKPIPALDALESSFASEARLLPHLVTPKLSPGPKNGAAADRDSSMPSVSEGLSPTKGADPVYPAIPAQKLAAPGTASPYWTPDMERPPVSISIIE